MDVMIDNVVVKIDGQEVIYEKRQVLNMHACQVDSILKHADSENRKKIKNWFKGEEH